MDGADPSQLVELLGKTEGMIHWAATSKLIERGKAATDALLEGLKRPNAKIRATCALLLDHVADNRCIEPLLHAIRHDPKEAVRRCALHALVCDGCKECPLATDVVGVLIETVLNDGSKAVKRRAVFYLGQQRSDERAITILKRLLEIESDPVLIRRSKLALARLQAMESL